MPEKVIEEYAVTELTANEINLINYIRQYKRGLERLIIILKTTRRCDQDEVKAAEVMFEQGIAAAIRSVENPARD